MIPAVQADPLWPVLGLGLALLGYVQTWQGVRQVLSHKAMPWGALLIASAALMVLWHIRAGTMPGLSLHLLGAMLCTLVFGPALAVIPLSLALLSVYLLAPGDIFYLGLNICLLVFWPILISVFFNRLVAKLPANIFVFIFAGGFFSSAGVVLLTGWTLAAVLWLMQIYPWSGMLEDFAAYWLLVAFSEAWLTGMLLTVLVVYRPERVAMFDAVRYIDQA
ncbi:MAG: hypothetical protein FGM35_00495 [Rhodocyclaceae bacterium]|nr:hypothetical protein [Rhodocyclaceae bacterium]